MVSPATYQTGVYVALLMSPPAWVFTHTKLAKPDVNSLLDVGATQTFHRVEHRALWLESPHEFVATSSVVKQDIS